MAAGNFTEIYGDAGNASNWAGVVTCFFMDTAPVILDYIDVIARILKPGGVWVNLGPLLYHWVADIEANQDERYGLSVEVSKVSLIILITFIVLIMCILFDAVELRGDQARYPILRTRVRGGVLARVWLLSL